MKILITGDKGFVGSATRKILDERGHEVVGYDLMDGFDIRDYNQFLNVCKLKTPNRILHLAATSRFADADKDPKLAFENNVIGTRNIVTIAGILHIPLVFASTGSAYMPIKLEPPITEEFPIMGNSVYGCSKAIADLYVQTHTPHIILRYAHLYGKEKRGHGLIGGYFERIKRGLSPVLYGGAQSNDFTYIDDVAEANYLALTASWDKWNQAYNIGTGEELSAEKAGEMICEVLGYKGEVDKKKGREVDPGRFVYDISKAKRMLDYSPKFSFMDGLKKMFEEETKEHGETSLSKHLG